MSHETARARWEDFGPDDLVTESEAAQLLRLSIHSLRAWRVADPPRGPKVRRLGASVRYALKDLRTFVDRAASDTVDDPSADFVRLHRRTG